jgi:hypothetical protein
MSIPHSIVGHVSTVFGKGRSGERLGLGFRPVKPPTEHPIPSLMLIDTKLPEEQRSRLFYVASIACAHQLLVEITSSSGTADAIDEIEIWNHE